RSVAVDATGRLRLDDLDVTDAAVVACQAANHEVGTVQPVTEVAAAIGDVPLFVDACASAGRLDLPDGWAAAAASALQAVVAQRATENARTHALVGWIRRVVGGLENVEVVGDPSDRLPHVV